MQLDVVATEASGDLMGSSEAEMFLVDARGAELYSYTDQLLNMACPLSEGVTLGKTSFG